MTLDELDQLAADIYASADVGRLGELRQGIASTDGDETARSNAVVGGAFLIAYKLGHDPADLDRALAELERAESREPLTSGAVNLAVALLERAKLPGRGDAEGSRRDHVCALELLEAAVAETASSDSRWVDRATILLGALINAVGWRVPGYDFEPALQLGEELVTVAHRRDLGNGEPQNLLGRALLAAVEAGHPSAGFNSMS